MVSGILKVDIVHGFAQRIGKSGHREIGTSEHQAAKSSEELKGITVIEHRALEIRHLRLACSSTSKELWVSGFPISQFPMT
jgi:hypothetical protein